MTVNDPLLDAIQSGAGRPPASLRMVHVELQKIEGIPVIINDGYRSGTITFDQPNQRIVTSFGTFNWMGECETRGGAVWGKVANAIRTGIQTSEVNMRETMVDLKHVADVVDRRQRTATVNDRVDRVCQGISDLTSQMAAMLSGKVVASPEAVASVAKRYSAAAAEMGALRAALQQAEGMFEIAQVQVVQLMEAED